MGKRQQKELQRLEEALLESEYTEAFPTEKLDPVHKKTGYDLYNSDAADVDMDDYSEDVYQARSGRGLSVFLTMLAMLALSSGILLLLKLLGVL